MEEKLSGIVLKGISYGENDKILTVFTLEKGLISAKIKGVKKAGAKLKFASEPFCFAEFVLSSSSNKRTVIGATLIESFYPLRENLIKYYAGATILEFVLRFSKENIVDKELFFTVIEGLKELAYSEKEPTFVLTKFLLQSLKETGYALNLNCCARCGCEEFDRAFFDYNSGCFYCEDCFDGKGREINVETFRILKGVSLGELRQADFVKPLRLLNYYLVNKCEEQITSFKELLNLV